jgi:hypothetical protein
MANQDLSLEMRAAHPFSTNIPSAHWSALSVSLGFFKNRKWGSEFSSED